MRKINSIALAMVAIILSVWTFSSCSNNNSKVSSFEINQSIKTLQMSYKANGKDAVFADSLPIYSMVDLCITWPERLGDKSIDVLRDSLLVAIFGTDANDIETAMLDFAKKPLGQDQFKMTALDSIPSSIGMFYTNNISVSMREMSQALLVYDITKYSYMGGAHGATMTQFLNYDVDEGVVLSYDNVFKPGKEEELLEAVRQELYNQYNVENAKQLESAGLFSDQIFLTHNFYINDYSIVFFYNTYEIAPYAFGSIEVTVPYYKIENCLTPAAANIFKI